METYWSDKIVLIGPFVGSFEYEMSCFRPFVYWLKNNFNFPNIIVSSHYNRSFLYDLPVIPIFKQYSNDEKGQLNHKHDRINAKDYQYLTNDIKDQLISISNWNKKDVIVYNLGYSSTPNFNSLYKKNFIPFFKHSKSNKMVFIPHKSRSNKELKKIHNHFNEFLVIGPKQERLKEFNKLMDFSEEIFYKELINELENCRCVITPCSFWTLICNLHQIPVFSWGNNISLYKNIYNFNNKKFKGIPFKKGNNINILIDSIYKFLEEIC